jgi:dipeptidyl aminopeptidase/acylaminoacyl peptidase
MATGARLGIGDNAVSEFLGGATPDRQPDVYELADPMAQVPTGVRTLLVHGDADDRVPVELSRNYAAAARAAGDDCELMELPGVDHFALIDPRTSAWSAVAQRLPALREPAG